MEKSEENIKDIFFPVALARYLESHKRYDEAIEFYQRTNPSEIKEEKKNEAIDKCKRDRDGFIDNQLKETLRQLSPKEQKQLIGYSKVFQIKIKLRKLVNDILTKNSGSKKWWASYVDSPDKLKSTAEEVKKRKSKFESIKIGRDIKKDYELLDFTTLPELIEIIKYHYKYFKDCFGPLTIVEGKLQEINNIRLDVAHARSIDDEQLQTLSAECEKINKAIDRCSGN